MKNTNSLITLIKQGKVTQIKNLIANGIDINNVRSGYSALHWAVVKGRQHVVTLLLEKGADHKLRTDKGLTPIELAVYSGKNAIVKELFPLYRAKERALLLHKAAALDDDEMCEMLIEMGLDVNVRDSHGRNAIHWAAQEGSIRSAKVLCANGANLNSLDSDKFTPLAIASSEGHARFVKFLLENGANVNKKTVNGTALHLASAWQRVKIVNLLLKYNTKLNLGDDEGKTALHYAAMYCHDNIVKVLVRNGAKKTVRDHNGETPLDLARKCDAKITKMLS